MNGESRRKARLWLGLVFVLGAAIGGVFGYNFGHKSYAANVVKAPSLSEPERRAKRVAEMTKEVGLTQEQSARVDAIIHSAHDRMKAIHEKSDMDIDAVREEARNQMREFLTPEQKPKFEAMVQRTDAERKRAK
jgi:Spy/CpxP family protein refolding chaperone